MKYNNTKNNMKVRLIIKKKEGVLDTEGKAIFGAISGNGFEGITSVHKAICLDLVFDDSLAIEEVDKKIQEMCEKFLVNQVIECYEYQVI